MRPIVHETPPKFHVFIHVHNAQQRWNSHVLSMVVLNVVGS